jgi:hypothetical protein
MKKRISTLAALAVIAAAVAGPSAAQASLPTGGKCTYHMNTGPGSAGYWTATCSYTWGAKKTASSTDNLP